MAGLNIFVVVAIVLVTKDGAFSCSLRSHKHDSAHPCSFSASDSTSISQLTPVPKPHTISSPCDYSSGSRSCSSSVHQNGSATSSKPTLSPDMSSPGLTPFIPATPSLPFDNTDILNSLIKLLSSPAFSTLQAAKSPTSYQPIVPSQSTSNTAQFSTSVSKAQTTPLPYTIGSGSSFPSSILRNPPYGSVSSTTSTVLRPQLSYSIPTPTYAHFASPGDKKDLINCLVKISPLVPSPSALPTLKSTPLSPLCPMFTPTLTKNNQGTKPCIISHPVRPLSSILPGVPHGPSLPSDIPVPGMVSVKAFETFTALTPASSLEHGPETVTVKFPTIVPATSTVPGSTPVVASTSTSSTFSGSNPDLVNYLLKKLLSYQTQNGSSSPQIPTETPIPIPTSNATPSNIKPHIISPACATPPGSSSSCSPSVLPNQSNGSISPLQQMLMSMTPPPVSGISSGYNPEFMKLLIKNLLSNATSSLLPLSSLFPLLQSKLDTTSSYPLPPTPDPFPMSTFNKPLSELNQNVSSNNTFDSAADSNTNQNISISNNQILTNILIKLLTSSNASKTPILPCSSSSSPSSISVLSNTPKISDPCIPLFSSFSDILSKFPSLTPGSKPSFPGPIPNLTIPFTNVKPFLEQEQNVTPTSTLTPNLNPLAPSLDIDPCHLKLKLPLKLSSLTFDAKTPCLKNIKQPHTPHLPSPCSLPSTKLTSGCKLLSPVG